MKSINDESFQTFGNIIDEDISDVGSVKKTV